MIAFHGSSVDTRAWPIATDSYSMSVGELLAMYKEGELILRPEFQRVFRLMNNSAFFEWIYGLSESEHFQNCIPLSDRAIEEQFALELVTRFIVLHDADMHRLRNISELGDYLTDAIIEKSNDGAIDKNTVEASFSRTFGWLDDKLGQDSFKRYHRDQEKTKGGLLISIYEVIALGIGYHASDPKYELDHAVLDSVHRELPGMSDFTEASGSGIPGTRRLPKMVALGRKLFE